MTIVFVIVGLILFGVGFFTGETFGHSAEMAKFWQKLEQQWFEKYLLATRENYSWADKLVLERKEAAEFLRDNIELERYLRDEERDRWIRLDALSLSGIAEAWDCYHDLWDAVRQKGANIKSLRKAIAAGKL